MRRRPGCLKVASGALSIDVIAVLIGAADAERHPPVTEVRPEAGRRPGRGRRRATEIRRPPLTVGRIELGVAKRQLLLARQGSVLDAAVSSAHKSCSVVTVDRVPDQAQM